VVRADSRQGDKLRGHLRHQPLQLRDDHRQGGGSFRTAAHGDEDRDEGHYDCRRGLTDSDASEHLPGFHGDKVAEEDPGPLPSFRASVVRHTSVSF
jgi:hypothetical protein